MRFCRHRESESRQQGKFGSQNSCLPPSPTSAPDFSGSASASCSSDRINVPVPKIGINRPPFSFPLSYLVEQPAGPTPHLPESLFVSSFPDVNSSQTENESYGEIPLAIGYTSFE